MKLITENDIHEFITEEIIDEKTGKKELYIKGIFMQAEIKNRNGRTYPVATLKREVDRYITEYVKTGRALGELNHPASVQVNPERASHLITEMWQEGNNFYGKAKILDTPMGRIVRGIIEGGGSLGVSSRGVGSLKEVNGVKVVQDDFRLCCIDTVSDPSAQDAWVDGIYESVEYEMKDGTLVESKVEEKVIEEKKEDIKEVTQSKWVVSFKSKHKDVEVSGRTTSEAIKKAEKIAAKDTSISGVPVHKKIEKITESYRQVKEFSTFMDKLTNL